MVNVWFAGFDPIVRILAVGTLGYVALVVLLRVSGKRTLAQMSSFDFVITVAIGATFGRVMTARSVPLVEAVTAFALLIVLQFLVTQIEMRAPWFARLVTASPRMLAYQGRIIPEALRAERLTEEEVLSAVRLHGYGDLDETLAVVMETTGIVAVVGPDRAGGRAALRPVTEDPAS